MLTGFGARNFYSFKEGADVSFLLPNKCLDKYPNWNNVSFSMCVKGSNASGKTCLLRIPSFISYFITSSFDRKPDTPIPVMSYFNNDDPIDLYCSFILENVEYLYVLKLTKEAVLSEVLSRKKKKWTEVFHRDANTVTAISEYKDLESVRPLRQNASLISCANQWTSKCILPIHKFFSSVLSNVTYFGEFTTSHDFRDLSKYYYSHKDVFASVKEYIRRFDLGIKDIHLQKGKDADGKDTFFPIFEHLTSDSYSSKLPYSVQSLGTKGLFQFLTYFIALQRDGVVLILDEFDTSLHPDILEYLIHEICEGRKRVHRKLPIGQIIFTTHAEKIMDYMGTHRTVIVNKEKSESYCYRLDELGSSVVRNDRSIFSVYNRGLIGGKPKLE